MLASLFGNKSVDKWLEQSSLAVLLDFAEGVRHVAPGRLRVSRTEPGVGNAEVHCLWATLEDRSFLLVAGTGHLKTHLFTPFSQDAPVKHNFVARSLEVPLSIDTSRSADSSQLCAHRLFGNSTRALYWLTN